jgi:hypothetical protein
MKCVKIYLRSVNQKDRKRLSLFDTERNGDIDDLVTKVKPGTMIIWGLDRKSGIQSIDKISPKKGDGAVFKSEPKKRFLCKGFKLFIPKDAKPGEEAYNIDYTISKKEKLTVDPHIIILPPDE